ncbi:MAG: hypothetical protein ACP6KW_11240 [Candidatus Thorarchaeota archaeon]
MRRYAVILLLFFVTVGVMPVGQYDIPTENQQRLLGRDSPLGDPSTLAQAGGGGDDRESTAFMSYTIESQTLDVNNSYQSPAQHTGEIDLTGYHISGWTLYRAVMNVGSMTAIAERETMGITPNDYIKIHNDTYDSKTNLTTDALYQEFYNQNHDGKLENYSINYLAPQYDTYLGTAYLVVRSDYSDPSTNTTGWIAPFSQVFSEQTVTHDCSSDNAILDASTSYYVVIDGTGMTGMFLGTWRFNRIYWPAQTTLGLETGYHVRDYSTWYICEGLFPKEAELNYTYTPWNKTTNAALTYADPTDVSLRGNLTTLSGLSWEFEDNSNMNVIQFDSHQSVEIGYNLTLFFRRDIVSSASWNVAQPGQDVEWNVTSVVTYPAISQSRYLNTTIPRAWTTTGLYETDSPGTNHTTFEKNSGVVTCEQMSNGTWTLTSTSHNHLSAIDLYQTSGKVAIQSKSRMDYDIDINATIREQDSDVVTTGSVNMTIWHKGAVTWNPLNKSVNEGTAHYFWNVTDTVTENGLYTVEEFWSNGTEAGYRTRDVVLFYPTGFTSSFYSVDAYTDSSFDIRVHFNDTYTPQDIDGSLGTVFYSFDGGTNTTLTDHNNGTWTATIDTTGKSPGTYYVRVFGQGYALENRTLTINATLIHDTTPLTIQWSNTNTISYVESTELSVAYQRVGGTPVPDAWVNVTIGSDTWNMTYDDVSGTYKLLFSGTDSPPGLGTHSISISAWREGYESQSDSSETLTINPEDTSLAISWTNTNTITYVESTTLVANYTMSNGSAVVGATVTATIGTIDYALIWDGSSETYRVTISGADSQPGLGSFSVIVHAEAFGYVSRDSAPDTLTITEEPTSMAVSWIGSSSITYVESTTLVVDFQMSNLSHVEGASVTVTIGSTTWNLMWHSASGTYRYQFEGSAPLPGLGTHSLTVSADRYGFQAQTDTSETLTISEEPTSMDVQWSNGNDLGYFDHTYLLVDYKMSNSTAIRGATVNVTIDGITWNLIWNSTEELYSLRFNGSDSPPGFGTHSLTIHAGLHGYVQQTDATQTLTLPEVPTTLIVAWLVSGTITYIEDATLAANYTMFNGTAVQGATVNVTISGVTWAMLWDSDSQQYLFTFHGDQDPPGLGTHSLSILADKIGFDGKSGSETLTINIDPTSLSIVWSDPDMNITYHGNTTLSVQYLSSAGTPISGAQPNATIGTDVWPLVWNPTTSAYETTFFGDDARLGLGTFEITIRASLFGYEPQTSSGHTLIVSVEPTSIVYNWNPRSNITYVESTILGIHYVMSNGSPIVGAIVNVTIGTDVWDAVWNATSGAYEVIFHGTDNPPDIGEHNLIVRASKANYQDLLDYSEKLRIIDEPTAMNLWWESGVNSITYVEYATLWVNYTMSNGTTIPDAVVDITIGTYNIPTLAYDSGSGFYYWVFHGYDDPPGLGNHILSTRASKYGYEQAVDNSMTLAIGEESATVTASWSNGDNVSYVGHTILFVDYRMSNGSEITGAQVNVSIGGQVWTAEWNSTAGLYTLRFDGAQDPPGLGTHSVTVVAARLGFEEQTVTESLTIYEEDTSLTPFWTSAEFDWTQSIVLGFAYASSNGSAIPDATQLDVFVDGVLYTLSGSNGTYWIVLNNTFDLGTHTVEANVSKHGYLNGYADSITFEIREAPTGLTLDLSSTTIDYLGQIDLQALYTCNTTSGPVPMGEVTANISIDGDSPIPLVQSGSFWIINLTGTFLDLGSHDLIVTVDAHGYEYAQTLTQVTVLEVMTDPLVVVWQPTNLTIEYFDLLNLTVDFTYYGGDVPEPATVNVTISGHTYDLTYNGSVWSVSIPGPDMGLGIHSALVSASAYGYQSTSAVTSGINVTQTANFFLAVWEPSDLQPSYVDEINLTVIYTEDFQPILGATVLLIINQSDVRSLVYSVVDERWHLSINASTLGLGVWNMTVTANKTGYASGIQTDMVSVVPDTLELTPSWFAQTTDYVTPVDLQIQVESSRGQPVLNATVEVTVNGTTIQATHIGSGLYELSLGPLLSIGSHSVNITVQGSWFYTSTSTLILTVSETGSTLTVVWSNTTLYFTQSITAEIYYDMLNGTPIGGTCLVTVNGSVVIATWVSDHWEFVLDGIIWGPGSHLCALNLSAYGFVSQVSDAVIVVRPNPTNTMLREAPSQVLINQSFVVRADYVDAIEGVPIVGASVSVEWSGDHSIVDIGNGTYEIHLTAVGMSNMSYSLSVTFQKVGYETSTMSMAIQVANRPLTAVFESHIVQYENETVMIEVMVFDATSASIVRSARVTATVEGTEFNLYYDSGREAYLTDLFLGTDITTGNHSILILIEGDGFDTLETSIVLTVLEKADYAIRVLTSEAVRAGDSINVTIIMTTDSKPVAGATVRVTLELTLSGGDQVTRSQTATTGEDGSAYVIFDVPATTTAVQVSAEFEGSVAAWPVESEVITVEVVPASGDVAALILGILMNPISIIGIAGASAAAVGLKRRKNALRVTELARSVKTPSVSVSPPSDLTRLRDLLATNPDGLTRREISEKLSLSSSKTGALVRDLLSSDEQFYEWRDGKRRLIRFKS